MSGPIKTLLLASTLLAGVQLAVIKEAFASETIVESCWQNSYTENFDELSLWNPETNTGAWKTSYIWGSDIIINNELQYYVDPRTHSYNPFSIDQGILTISAVRTPIELLSQVKNMPFVSGVLTTEKGFSQKYGRFEARLRVPKGQGLWSAFWLLPSFDQWPDGVAVLPEIDVMESLGHETKTFHTTLHTNQTGKLTSHPYDHTKNEVISDDFHLFSVVWDAKTVKWYYDKKKVAEHETPADFTRPVHFLLNLAVGGTWPGHPDRTTKFPARYQVDYVKAFTKKAGC